MLRIAYFILCLYPANYFEESLRIIKNKRSYFQQKETGSQEYRNQFCPEIILLLKNRSSVSDLF